jgi:hypothetical protein
MGEEVEIEFALDVPIGPTARRRSSDVFPAIGSDAPTSERRGARLYVLQVRPMTTPESRQLPRVVDELGADAYVCHSDVALGHGAYEGIRDIVWVDSARLDAISGREIAARLGELNAELLRQGRGYLLIGPGRWGSTDATLGVPVGWADIAGARVIVETPIGNRSVEPSQGTHFFRNITAARIGYVTVEDRPGSELDRNWLKHNWQASSASRRDERVRHLRLDAPLAVHIDGRRGMAVMVKSDERLAARVSGEVK